MSLDPTGNWSHDAALERGDTPRQIPETTAAVRLASLVGTYIDRRYITDYAIQDFANKVIANRGPVRRIFDQLDADPKRLREPHRDLRQQQSGNREDDMTFWLEQAAYYKRGYEEAVDMIDRLTARAVAEHDVDEREQDRENHRLREQAQDERAAENAPKVAT